MSATGFLNKARFLALGCTRYTIHVNGLPDYIDLGDLYMYADDATLYCIAPNVDQVTSSLNDKMKQVLLWSAKNRLTIHQIKSKAMIGPLPPLPFTLGHLVNSTTFLGVIIGRRLSWFVHINSVKKHFTQKVGALKRMRMLPELSLEELYFKSIIPSITYSTSVWGNCLPSAMN